MARNVLLISVADGRARTYSTIEFLESGLLIVSRFESKIGPPDVFSTA